MEVFSTSGIIVKVNGLTTVMSGAAGVAGTGQFIDLKDIRSISDCNDQSRKLVAYNRLDNSMNKGSNYSCQNHLLRAYTYNDWSLGNKGGEVGKEVVTEAHGAPWGTRGWTLRASVTEIQMNKENNLVCTEHIYVMYIQNKG